MICSPETNAAYSQDDIRAALLAHFRIADAELEVLQSELELIGGALQHRLLTSHQAMQMAFEHDVLDWLFRDREATA